MTNLIIRKGMAFLLIVTLILSGFFVYPGEAQALMIEKTVTKYHLDIGVQQIWGVFTGEYDSNGKEIVDWDDDIGPGGTMYNINSTITFSKTVSNVKAYEYSATKFDWDDSEHYTSNVGSKDYFDDNYLKYKSNSINVTNYSSSGKNVSFSYDAKMSSTSQYDLKEKLNLGQINEVFHLMAGPNSSNPEGDVKKNFPSLYSKLNAGRNGVDSKVRAYMYFTPVIIQYDVKEMVEVGAIDADLTVPATAKAGENYNAADNSYVEDVLTLTYAVLEKRIDGGEWQPVTVWEGTGQKGKNTGGSITEMSEEICTITYRLTITASDGQTDTAEKSITITDGREIEGKAILELDKYTYEGHPADAEDWSEFTVDGVRYSAKRAYEEKIASNKFRTESGTVKKDGYDAIVTYPKRGVYPVNLEVTLKTTGQKLTDTKNIEVRKTPYVEASLGGYQKQNRKQMLTFKIATYPDKPIVNYDITIKDLKSNEVISLTKDAPQENGACIKTRTVKEEINNQYWTTLTVEFLTKYPRYSLTGDASQSFSYRIKVTDSKGDSDEAYKEFDVAPDKPPIPAINMQTSFLRSEGTNTARLEATDGSQSDGDQLLRTWSIVNHNPLDNKRIGEFVNATTVEGYENLAFGTNQTIGWNKEGVGKTTVKLHIKDIWVEPTLEEYIVPSDYLEAETTAGTEVINIAPKVSIEPLETLKANIAILINANEYQAMQNQTNNLQAALIEKGIDGNVSLVKLANGAAEGQSRIEVDKTVGGGANNADSERMYLYHGADSSSMKIVAYDNNTTGIAKVLWSYPVDINSGSGNIVSIYVDRNREKYVVANQMVNGTKTAIILDRNTGAYLTRINGIYLDGEIFLSNDEKRIYCVNDTGIYKLDLKTGQYKCLVNDTTIRKPRMNNGKIGFAAKLQESQYYIGSFDMQTEQLDKAVGPVYDYASGISKYGDGSLNIADWSNDGKILIIRTARNYGDDYGGNVWLVDTKNATGKNISNNDSSEDAISGGLILDNYGNCQYIVVTTVHRSEAYKYYNYAAIIDLQGNQLANTSYKDSGRHHLNRSFYDEESNTITLLEPSFYGKQCVYDLNKKSWVKEWKASDLDTWTGSMDVFDNGFYSFNDGYNDGRWDPFYYMYFQRYLTEQDVITYKSLKRNATFESNADTYIAFTGIDNSDLSMTNDFIKMEGAKNISTSISENLESLADKIKEKSQELKFKLQLMGNKDNYATVKKEINLIPNTRYDYSFDAQILSGTAIDVFTVERMPDNGNGTKYYKEVVYQEDFSDKYGGKREQSGVDGFSFTLDKAGYVSFIMQDTGHTGRQIYLDGKQIDDSSEQQNDELHFLVFVPAGKHTITTRSVSSGVTYVTNIKCAEAGYITTADNTFNPSNVGIQEGTVKGSFISPKEVLLYKDDTMYSATKINAYDLVNKGYMTYGSSSGYGYIAGENQLNVHSDARVTNKGYLTANLNVTIKAPPDKKLLIRSTSDKGVIRLNEGEQTYFNYSTKVYYGGGQGREFAVMSDIEAVEIPAHNSAWYGGNAIILGNASVLAAGNKVSAFNYGKEFYWIDTSTINCKVYKCRIGEKKDSNTIIGLTNVNSNTLLKMLISNLKLEMINNSKNAKGVQFKEKFAADNSLDNWQLQTKGSGRAEMVQAEPAKKEEDAPLVYKKGQLIKYNIYYSDYEEDLSKSGYWLYAHTPYNDGSHPDAAIIYDEDGNIKSICGEEAVTPGAITIDDALNIAKAKGLKILTEPIDRFYIDGKYVVYHWEYDNTSRGLIAEGYPAYDKASNTADLTFYIEGGASAPWITGISTSPAKVTENNYFSINVGIDDNEKDILNLTTEVYKDRKHIFTHRKKNIWPVDASGIPTTNPAIAVGYPVTNTGALPDKAQAGTYEVVCTVRDQTGAGIGQYKFIVVSEGKITGEVYHTEQWDINRKKYNLNRFKDEINKAIPYAEYMKLKEPRTRGTNVFWSGEKFMLNAAVASTPTKVTCSINGTSYKTTMKNSGKKNAVGETIYTGSIWDKAMINKWGRKAPEELTFTFTAEYSSGIIKKHEVKVIVDNMDDYWKLHRAF